jgi:hypothetical protein
LKLNANLKAFHHISVLSAVNRSFQHGIPSFEPAPPYPIVPDLIPLRKHQPPLIQQAVD